jgi:nitroreductase
VSQYYQKLFGNDLVEAESVEDFAARYRRHDRYGGLTEAQREAILKVHRLELEAHGITWIAGYDSNAGKLVSWSPSKVEVQP